MGEQTCELHDHIYPSVLWIWTELKSKNVEGGQALYRLQYKVV